MATTDQTPSPDAEARPTQSDAQPVGRMWMIDLAGSWPTLQPAIPATFDRVGSETADALAAAMGLSGTGEVRRRLDSGRRCYGAWVGGELAAYGWVSFNEEGIGSLELTVRLLPGEAYIWDCATLPAFRRHSLYSALLTHILSALRDEGLRRAWIGADLANAPSQAGIARAGFLDVVDVVDVGGGGPMPRRLGLQARPGIPDQLFWEAQRLLLGIPREDSVSGVPPSP
jgi:ribosomal protein S18 acetylase RimI-like enzyme